MGSTRDPSPRSVRSPGGEAPAGGGTAAGEAAAGVWCGGAVVVAAVLPLASTAALAQPSWALRWALLPAVGGAGLAALVSMAGRRPLGGPGRRAARLALGWIAWAVLATVLAPQLNVALWGEYRVGTGLVFLTALAGAWALGASGGRRAPGLVSGALLWGCVANAALAVGEQLTDLSDLGVSSYQGRSAGLYGNPVYLAELLAGGLWLALWRVGRPVPQPRRAANLLPVGAVAVIAVGIELSGSRSALLLAVLATGWAARTTGRGRRRVLIGAVAAGLALGAAVGALAPGATTGTDRVAADSGGYRPRVDTWESGLRAVGRRPLWGWGPGGFLAATGPRRSLTVARQEGPDTLFADAHDAVIESLVTTGVVGTGLLGLWLAAAVGFCLPRPRRRSPAAAGEGGWGLAGFAALVGAGSLVEPLHPGVTPLALLALGAAGAHIGPAPGASTGGADGETSGGGQMAPAGADRSPWRGNRRRPSGGSPAHLVAHQAAGLRPAVRLGAVVTAVTAAAGLGASCWLVAGLAALHAADVAGDPAAAAGASRRLPPWGEPAAVTGRLVAFQGISRHDEGGLADARRWWSIAARRDPADPSRWNDLGDARGRAGDAAGAAAAYRLALADNPWSARALRGLLRVGSAGGVTGPDGDRARARLHLLGASGRR